MPEVGGQLRRGHRLHVHTQRAVVARPRERDQTLDDLERAGGFQRANLLVVSTTGSGWVDPALVDTFEYFSGGDAATVAVDAYPGRTWRASVASLSPATGAEFALLPPQNASGNWIKVVQRIPLRLRVDLPAGSPALRAGMSVTATIDTGHRRTFAGLLRDLAFWR